MDALDKIYLVDSDEGWDWCSQPAPGLDMDPADAIEYIRIDRHQEEIDQLKARVQRLCQVCNHAQFYSADDAIAKQMFDAVRETPAQSLAEIEVAAVKNSAERFASFLIDNQLGHPQDISIVNEYFVREAKRIRSNET